MAACGRLQVHVRMPLVFCRRMAWLEWSYSIRQPAAGPHFSSHFTGGGLSESSIFEGAAVLPRCLACSGRYRVSKRLVVFADPPPTPLEGGFTLGNGIDFESFYSSSLRMYCPCPSPRKPASLARLKKVSYLHQSKPRSSEEIFL